MTRTDLQEAAALLAMIAGRLGALPPMATSPSAADLRRATGAVIAEAESLARSTAMSSRLLTCFQLATAAGATLAGFYALRAQILAAPAVGVLAQIVRRDANARAIIQMARCVAATDFKSQDAITAAQSQVNVAYAAAEDEATDARDTTTYRTIVTLHAAVTRDLTSRARQLPRIVTIVPEASLPALVLAQRLYGDAGRADDLIAGNDVRAPLFMPRTVQALSA